MHRFIAALAVSLSVAVTQSFAVDVTWTNVAAGSWNDPLNWSSNPALPGPTDVAVFGPNPAALAAITLDAPQSVQGVRILSPGGTLTIGATGETATNTLTLGTSGIDMSSATVNAQVNSRIITNGDQSWQVAAGQTLNMWTVNNNSGVTGANNITLSGGGAVLMLPGQTGSVGFNDGNSNNGFTGNWTIGTGTLVQNIRNGRSAWGTGTINLAGGTIAPFQGNWTWTTPIALQTATSSTIDNKNTSGSNRYLKLQGELSGDGALTFANTGTGFTNNDLGFILTATNILSGSVTINANTPVRIGGTPGDVTTTGAGIGGTLGTATVTNNGTLTLSRSDAWTFGNAVSGTGALRIGGGVSGAGTQVVSVTGNNTYDGGTTVSAGTLAANNPTGTSATGTGAVTVANNATLAGGADTGVGSFTGSATGYISGDVTVQTGGRIAPGNSVGTLTVGSATFADGSAFNLELGSTNPRSGPVADINSNDRLNVLGALSFGTSLTVNVDGTGQTFVAGNDYDFFILQSPSAVTLPGTVTFNPTNFATPGAFSLNLAAGGNAVYVTFTPVPEPATAMAIAFGGVAVAGWYRRRRAIVRA